MWVQCFGLENCVVFVVSLKRRIQSNGIKFYYHIMGYNG